MNVSLATRLRKTLLVASRRVHYVQGQSPEERIREYFYFIDHQGQLFLDDARIKNFTSCFKEKKFLQFFFSRLEKNNVGRYSDDFPFLSLCGRERNFIRCEDIPIVFTALLPGSESKQPESKQPNQQTAGISTSLATAGPKLRSAAGSRSSTTADPSVDRLSYGSAGELLTVSFIPTEISMLPSTGRVYHPGPDRAGGVGLVKSSLAIELSKHFEFRNGDGQPPTHFRWQETTHCLTNSVIANLEKLKLFSKGS